MGWQLATLLEIEADHDGLLSPCKRRHIDAVEHVAVFPGAVLGEHKRSSLFDDENG
jgi:hypothetical protein